MTTEKNGVAADLQTLDAFAELDSIPAFPPNMLALVKVRPMSAGSGYQRRSMMLSPKSGSEGSGGRMVNSGVLSRQGRLTACVEKMTPHSGVISSLVQLP
jgi:hypothetical protein